MNIKDYLHYYIGCDVLVRKETKPRKLECVSKHYRVVDHTDGFYIKFALDTEEYEANDVKLLLRPLSNMTTGEKYKFEPKEEEGEIGQEFIGSESETSYAFVSFIDMARTINQLRKLGFDCDGLIEAGLAISKSEVSENG